MTESQARQLEQWASAHLDGELDADQSADLYRDLLREPDAREMLEDWSEADRMASEALHRAVNAPSRAVSVDHLARHKIAAATGVPWMQLLVTVLLALATAGVWWMLARMSGE